MPFVRRPSPEQELQAAAAQWMADSVTSTVPAPVVNAMRTPGTTKVRTTVRGVPTTVMVPAAPLSPAEISSEWQRVLGAAS